MEETKDDIFEHDEPPMTGFRMVHIIVLETLMVLLVGLLIWGVLSEVGLFWPGLITAIVIWVCVSPVIEIATVLRVRGDSRSHDVARNERISSISPKDNGAPN